MKLKLNKFTTIGKIGSCVLAMVCLLQVSAFAQNASAKPAQMNNEIFWMLVLMGMVLMIAVLVLISTLSALFVVRKLYMQELEKKGIKTMTLWDQLMDSLNRITPLEQEKNILLDHNYDGIKELDNHLPPWWVYLFYGTIAFAVIYLFTYHIVGIVPTPQQEYQAAVETASMEIAEYKKLMSANIDETNVTFLKDDKNALATGAKSFEANCAACHGKNLEGGTGPNLTDEYWLHGGDVKDVFKTIKYGIPAKGMIAWEKKLKPDEIQNISSFILTKQGSKPANAKEPQGEKYVSKEKNDNSQKEG
ncbi:MAG: cbb3-type cytochrome c oxidase N-terminal domain-containing protein [Microscillaceae bacterium]|nr:cbb3-type cytochrome c oxidase N-terminal domain-containing protein [Microscillaceae bacterium]